MRFSVGDIQEYCSGHLLCGMDSVEVRGLSWDSRAAKAGDLYLALPGERVDGHDFCIDAVRAGAHAVLVSKNLSDATLAEIDACGACAVAVNDSMEALQQLARAWRQLLDGCVIALSGSSGKTTTKNMLRDVLVRKGSVWATQKNQNNELGVPATLLAAEEANDFVVVEMGMRGAGQLASLCEIARPQWALLTNAGSAHIELLGSREAIARAKCELFDALPSGGIAFVNADCDALLDVIDFSALEQKGVQVVFYDGTGDWRHAAALQVWDKAYPSVWASDCKLDALGCASFVMHAAHMKAGESGCGEQESHPCALQLPGIHNVANAIAAAAVGLQAGLSLAQCCEALGASQATSGRQQILRCASGARIVDDSYNANPDSTSASLRSFAAMEVVGRRIAVLGDMLELGNFAQASHEEVGRVAAACQLSELICVGPLARFIAQAALASGMDEHRVVCVDSAEKALASLAGCVAENDAVLVKASHSMGLEAIVKGLVNSHV